jgi:hypothetical protein
MAILRWWLKGGFTIALAASAWVTPAARAAEAALPGEALYRMGVLPTGEPLVAEREGGLRIQGRDAACTNCHRRSGLGETEGRTIVPPIAGIYLFHARGRTAEELDLPFVEGIRADREPYTDETLARVIREGVAEDGHQLTYLMPHYQLDDAAMADLIAYLKHLSPARAPGVSDTVLSFATVITPDADPVKRQGMLDVLNTYFAEKNATTRSVAPRLQSTRKMMFRVARRWELHVWQLTGAPESWDAQLRGHLAAEPVFAVISGLGGATWAPVHHFCEQQSLPCLFPNVDLPVVAEDDFYPVYLDQGVLLEARLIAHELRDKGASGTVHRVIQVYRAGDVGEQAAQETTRALKESGLVSVDRRLKTGANKADLLGAVRDAGPGDALMLWLRPKDLAALPSAPVGASNIAISGVMGGLDDAPLPPAWRAVALMAYPVDLPERRRIRLDYPLGWFHIRQIPLVAPKVQADTYMACGLLAETLSHMTDTFVRDYLVERLESMVEHRVITGYYPRLSLAPRQRFASKGAYMVHFADPPGARVIADSDWIVP